MAPPLVVYLCSRYGVSEIHWRTDTDYSMTLGEAMAISILQEKAKCYHEKFSITFTKLDGNRVTISNQ